MRNIIIRSTNFASSRRASQDAVEIINNAKNDLTAFKSSANDYSSDWVSTYYKRHIGMPYCSVNRASSKYWYNQKNSDGTYTRIFRQATYDYDAAEEAKKWVRNQRTAYINAMSNLQAYLPTALDEAKKVKKAFEDIKKAREEFEATSYDLEDVYNNLNADIVGEDFVWDTESYVDKKTGETVEYQVLYRIDEDGKKISLNESVNCAVTTLGSTSDNLVALASSLNDKSLTQEEIDKILLDMIEKTGAVMKDYEQRGFFGVSTAAGIAGMYTDITGLDYDEDTVKADYNSVVTAYLKDSEEQGDYLANLVNASAIGAMGIAAVLGNAIKEKGSLTEEDKKEHNLEKYKKKPEEPTEEVYVGEVPKYGAPAAAGDVTVVDVPKVDTRYEATTYTVSPSGTSARVVSGKMAPIDAVTGKPLLDSNGLQLVTEQDLPAKIEEKSVTSTEIDLQASDEYYKKYSAEEIMETRSQLYDEYTGMTEVEKVSALQELGYREDVIADIVTNGTAGVTAYVIGHQNLEMAGIAREIAAQQGMMGYNPSYDAAASSTYFTSGEVLTDLVPSSHQVQAARTALNDAKVSYDAAITRANTAIDDANSSKDEYDRTLAAIKKRSGEDPASWSEEDVKLYNQATEKYNKAVEIANDAATVVDSEKQKYDAQKVVYTTAKEDLATQVVAEMNEPAEPEVAPPVEPKSQTMVGVDEHGEFITEVRDVKSPREVMTLDTNDLQQMQQYATIITEQEAKGK